MFNRRLQALAALSPLMAVSIAAAAMSSGSYSSDPVVNDEGGGHAASASYSTDASIGKDVSGLASTSNYQNEFGLVIIQVAPGDYTAPGPVTGFTATANGDAQIDLAWSNPGDADFAGVVVFRREGAAPTFTPVRADTYTVGNSYGDSVCVHYGAGTTASDTGLTASTHYYYAAHAFDAVPNYSAAASADATTSAVAAPTVLSTSPANGATGVEPDVAVTITFSKPMNEAATEGAFSISPNVTGVPSWTGKTMSFTPDALLTEKTTYTVTVATTATDAGGTPLAAPYEFSFTVRIQGGGWYGGGGCGGGVAVAVVVCLVLAIARRRTGASGLR